MAPFNALEKIRPHVDELVCLETPDDFYAVGQFYEDFSPVSDEEVISLLQQNKRQALG